MICGFGIEQMRKYQKKFTDRQKNESHEKLMRLVFLIQQIAVLVKALPYNLSLVWPLDKFIPPPTIMLTIGKRL